MRRAAAIPNCAAWAACAAGAALLACSPSRPGYPAAVTRPESPAGLFRFAGPAVRAVAPEAAAAAPAPAMPDVRYLLVYVIHGDADYVYHDASGRRRLADEDAVAQAREVGRNATAAEVFVFHQKPRWHLWRRLVPDGMVYHYRRGEQLAARSYSRAKVGSDFAAEAALFAKSASPAGEPLRFFAYFGHEIPVVDGRGYSRSHPGEAFSLALFARGLERFAGRPGRKGMEKKEKPFSLVVLSACRGGTPAATTVLFPYADWLIASPTELHLSFLDTRAFIPLLSATGFPPEARGGEPRRLRVEAAARQMVRESFAQLGEKTQTPIALALYDAEKASAYLQSRPSLWASDGESSRGVRMPTLAWRDCGEDPEFGPGGAEAGALVLYRAGRFGRLQAKRGHSGWECPQQPDVGWLGGR